VGVVVKRDEHFGSARDNEVLSSPPCTAGNLNCPMVGKTDREMENLEGEK
jgi:hypothetical protein